MEKEEYKDLFITQMVRENANPIQYNKSNEDVFGLNQPVFDLNVSSEIYLAVRN